MSFGPGARFAAEAHDEATFVDKVAGDVHRQQQQQKHHNKDPCPDHDAHGERCLLTHICQTEETWGKESTELQRDTFVQTARKQLNDVLLCYCNHKGSRKTETTHLLWALIQSLCVYLDAVCLSSLVFHYWYIFIVNMKHVEEFICNRVSEAFLTEKKCQNKFSTHLFGIRKKSKPTLTLSC